MYHMHLKSKVVVTDDLLDDERKYIYRLLYVANLKSQLRTVCAYKMLLIPKQLTVTIKYNTSCQLRY